MPDIEPSLYLGVNAIMLGAGFMLALLVLYFSARNQWLLGYGPQQRRIRAYVGLICIILVILGATGALFNIITG